ncbi:M24 family metallopeptidase [Herbaspirillum huttiense]|uniref:M24 family metallopeptidase n=1 Tax=Herbaspirillum huttiense TaxID=863372 RepID=UPI0039B0B082
MQRPDHAPQSLEPQPHQAERIGPAFSVDGMLLARTKTREAIDRIAAQVRPGMVEEDAVAMAKDTMTAMGLALSWHPTRVRFGSNTTKPMKVASVPGVVLQENDIFFLDIAPRVEAWEGDGGKSFVVGQHAQYARCAADAERLFHEVRAVWDQQRLSGQELYAFADKTARAMGWELNFDLPGHRVSDFPHAAIHTGSLADFEASPSAMRWILEIHLRDPQGRFGAFFEDMLLDDSYYSR